MRGSILTAFNSLANKKNVKTKTYQVQSSRRSHWDRSSSVDPSAPTILRPPRKNPKEQNSLDIEDFYRLNW